MAILPRVALGLLLAASAALGGPTPATQTLEARLETIRAHHDVPAVGALRLEGKAPPLSAVVGTRAADGDEPVELDDTWHLGSNTKAMTATLAARLVEKGKLGWDSTLAEVLPELADEMKAEYREVTLRQLLAHRGGIFGGEANHVFMPAMWSLQNDADQSPRQRRLEACRRILSSPPIDEPGGRFRYSNAGYVVAGAMLEVAGEAEWEVLLEEEVFEPLGMTSAGFGPPGRIRGHLMGDDAWQPKELDNPEILGPAATVHASLADWSRFAAAHLGHIEGFLTEESLKVLHEPLGDEEEGYALGWGVRSADDGSRLLEHAGSNTMWFALIVLDRGADAVYLAVCNAPSREACAEVVEALRDHPSP